MGRRELREQIFLLLFRVEFNNPEEMPAQLKMFFETGSYDEDMHSFSEKDREYITEKYNHIMESLPDIDKQLSEKAENWDITRMGKVELTVLRLAVYEIEKDDSVPASVAINEAVELAKKFGQDGSGAFVNAVLAKFV
ncbi:MAG: transcription antitermination factor NusB [Lachnospiraceae bacterium]|jgi:N utilization substance protein B|nr:transcription antitermination factor NusB [Clostridium sp.]MDD6179861.1 transcription antitermination factor NusB [Clostridium sp.]MDY4821367.1 transcription antitermination factor NusB [Lachnospiraceae bacterium]CDA67925.1 n utilization substance protein B homolog [Clostridium sp. CAG:510]